ncbi:MAG: FAD-dependent monooxygenase [Burkholderiaceae bacterium]
MKGDEVLIAGAGIGGLAAALACQRAGASVRVFERAPEFGEVGAGIQIGPNVTRILHAWGLEEALARVAAFPDRLQVRSAATGCELGVLPLGASALQRYGAPYATVHRADLHQLLLQALRGQGGVEPQNAAPLRSFESTAESVAVQLADGSRITGTALIGADGLWSQVRQGLLGDGAVQPTGHLAYRALLAQADLPAAMRSQQVTVWLGPQMHVVQYPVRGGAALNLVAIVHGDPQWLRAANATPGQLANWNQQADAADVALALRDVCAPLHALVDAAGAWRLWVLCDRPPMDGPQQHAQGRVALLGDAAHPMRPYLAQGAGMAIEDAQALGQCLGDGSGDVVAQLLRFANQRWRRNRQVQLRARRNGGIFHARGLVRFGRDAAMAVLGARLLDLPWLYRS